MLTEICGDPGTGKTALLTLFGQERMTGKAGLMDLLNSRREVNRLNLSGWQFTVPRRHLVFADYKIHALRNGYRLGTSYDIDGFRLGFANPHIYTSFLPPFSWIGLDEPQRYYNSRESKHLADWVSRWYETHRHWGLNIVMACQRPGLIDLNIREIAERFIFITLLKVRKDGYGRVTRVVWEWSSSTAATRRTRTRGQKRPSESSTARKF